ncbi:EF-hand domain-containing protein [Brevundimonas sp.]|jgi:Ca2+-binding EF-hand superfamily protein|uniref:EF-hand domain-containing protein n=1 Tax=Brevundimonas sp. TaxID=1871086 RepID=UPI00391CEC71|nr:EF-hand domain-containing protein [Brevundimonas sp.]
MKIKTLTLVAVGTLVLAGTASAQQQRGLGRADADADGRVSQAEFVTARTARLTEADANRDGQVTREEAQAAHQANRSERRGQMFARLDTDRNGAISQSEFDAARPERAGRGGQRMQRQERRAGRAFAQGPVQIEQARSRATQAFATLDADRDGYLSEIERQAAPARMREAMRERRAERRAQRGVASRSAPASE